MKNWSISYLIIGAVAGYILLLASRQQLLLYINPRYLNTTIVAGAFVITVSLLVFMREIHLRRQQFQFNIKSLRSLRPDPKVSIILVAVLFGIFTPLGFIVAALAILIPVKDSLLDLKLKELGSAGLIMVVVVALAIMLPAQTLSGSGSSQNISSDSFVDTGSQLDLVANFNYNSDQYELADWIRRINIDPDLSKYDGKEVNVSGFVYVNDQTATDQFFIARYRVACCAVDAIPVGLVVNKDSWKHDYQVDAWVRVRGRFEIANVNDQRSLVIIPEVIEPTEVPDVPYIYVQ